MITESVFSQLGCVGVAIATLGVPLSGTALAQVDTTWYNCLTREVFTPEKQAWCQSWQALQEATYIVPKGLGPDSEYTSLTLEMGQYQASDGPYQVKLVNQAGWMAFGDINGDGKKDAAVIFGVALDAEFEAVGTYLTAVLDVNGEPQALQPVKLGERIALNGPIAIEEGAVAVPLLTMTEVSNKAYVIDGDRLTERAQLTNTSEANISLPEGTLVFSQTTSLALRIFTEAGEAKINLFNKATGVPELSAAPVTVEMTDDAVIYRYEGEFPLQVTLANSGEQTITLRGVTLEDHESVTGTVTYLPRIALPPNAVVEVKLVDVSRADAPAIILASQQIMAQGRQVPFPFELVYDPEQIDPRFSYGVQARITVDGELRFISTTHTPVITRDSPTEVEVQVDQVSPPRG